MKKILIMALVVASAIAVNAATFKWNAANLYAADGSTKYTGEVSLYAVGFEDALSTVTASSAGAIALTEFSSSAFVTGTTYDFYFTYENDGKVFTSAIKQGVAADVGFTQLSFGNMASATQDAANWATAAAPEPTSGLLLLLGVAGLALRRKQK